MQIVRCNKCGVWVGKAEDLGLHYELDKEYCPKCKCTEALMDVDYGCNFDDTELEKLWELFGNVVINNDDEILEEFLGFPAGTGREEIWHWFDERYSQGVYELMHKGE